MENEIAARWIFQTSRQNQAKVLAHLLSKKDHETPFSHSIGEINDYRILQQGWLNIVLQATSPSGTWIIRIRPGAANVTPEEQFGKELHYLQSLSDIIPLPSLPQNPLGTIEFGEFTGSAVYMIQQYIEGTHLQKNIQKDLRAKTYEQIGSLAHTLHQTHVEGYGNLWNVEENTFSAISWKNHLQPLLHEYAKLTTRDEFREQRTLIASALERVEQFSDWSEAPSLYHHDFTYNWANLIFNKHQKIVALIDWETAGSGPAFSMDATSLLYSSIRDEVPPKQIIEDFESYLQGYKISWDDCLTQHLETLLGGLALEGLKAVYKYLHYKDSGHLFRQPWRRDFAKRALCMLESLENGDFDDLRRWAA